MRNIEWLKTLNKRDLENAIMYCQSVIVDTECLESGALDDLAVFALLEY